MSTLQTLDNALKDVESKFSTAQQKIAGLVRNGQPMFTDPSDQADMIANALKPLQQSVERAFEIVDIAEKEAKRLGAKISNDTWSTLSDSDLQRATLLKPFVADFIDSATAQELTSRLEWVIGYGKPLEKKLYHDLSYRRKDILERLLPFINQLVDPAQEVALQTMTNEATALMKKASFVRGRASEMLNDADGSKAADIQRRIAMNRF